jgi:hypothetical protein
MALFSSGIKSSLDIIIGKMENVFIIDAYVDAHLIWWQLFQKLLS